MMLSVVVPSRDQGYPTYIYFLVYISAPHNCHSQNYCVGRVRRRVDACERVECRTRIGITGSGGRDVRTRRVVGESWTEVMRLDESAVTREMRRRDEMRGQEKGRGEGGRGDDSQENSRDETR